MHHAPNLPSPSTMVDGGNLVLALTTRELRMRYQGTIFGSLWWLARPFAFGFVLYFAMGRVVQLGIENYGAFLMCALFPWFWFQSTLNDSAGVFVGNAGLVKKLVFPRVVLPLSSIAYNSAQFLIALPIMAIFVYFSGERPQFSWVIGIPVLFAVQLLLLIGFGILVSTLYVFFRDIGPILDVGLTLGFYLSPVIYPLDRVPDRFEPFLLINPMAPLLEAWRDLLIAGDLPGLSLWPTLIFVAAGLALGFTLFRRTERHFADAI
jgi:ABC-type polysaccharide/polyol phosphate export permease